MAWSGERLVLDLPYRCLRRVQEYVQRTGARREDREGPGDGVCEKVLDGFEVRGCNICTRPGKPTARSGGADGKHQPRLSVPILSFVTKPPFKQNNYLKPRHGNVAGASSFSAHTRTDRVSSGPAWAAIESTQTACRATLAARMSKMKCGLWWRIVEGHETDLVVWDYPIRQAGSTPRYPSWFRVQPPPQTVLHQQINRSALHPRESGVSPGKHARAPARDRTRPTARNPALRRELVPASISSKGWIEVA